MKNYLCRYDFNLKYVSFLNHWLFNVLQKTKYAPHQSQMTPFLPLYKVDYLHHYDCPTFLLNGEVFIRLITLLQNRSK